MESTLSITDLIAWYSSVANMVYLEAEDTNMKRDGELHAIELVMN
jgi:hypothetical protein